MATTTPESHVWGTGVMHPDFGVGRIKASNIHALRGKLSYAALRDAGINVPDVPLGDPAFLAPRLLGIGRSPSPTNVIGIVPHYVDRHKVYFRQFIAEHGVVDLNVHDEPAAFLQAMAQCDAIISSSLHGLIFAEALGIPNFWVTTGDEIAGGAFKFNDWFSMTLRPQTEAHFLSGDDSARGLASRAVLHDCTIDARAIEAAFPYHQLDQLCEPEPRAIVPVDVCRSRPTPVFLISFNRGPMLEQVIASIKGFNRAIDIVVHDNGSTDPATLAILNKLEQEGTRVVRREAIATTDDLNNVNETVQEYFFDWAEPSRYVVSDGDIDMGISASNTLDIYDELLNIYRQSECIGPMLKISDIPTSYPLFNRVINRHIEQFWHKEPEIVETSFGPAAIIQTVIDTTFALQRAGEPYRRLKSALRVYEPYEAQHLDWYIDCVGSDVYSTTSSAAISHWNNVAEFAVHEHTDLERTRFYTVRKCEMGTLEVREEQVPKKASQKRMGQEPRSDPAVWRCQRCAAQ